MQVCGWRSIEALERQLNMVLPVLKPHQFIPILSLENDDFEDGIQCVVAVGWILWNGFDVSGHRLGTIALQRQTLPAS